MERYHLAYIVYIIVLLALVGAIVLTPFLAFSHDVGISYDAFRPTCHQKLSRSLCVFSDGGGYWIADCTPQEGAYVTSSEDRETIEVQQDTIRGFKMPVCARDIGLYGAMLLGGLLYPLVRRLDDVSVHPASYLILAMVPLAIDGGAQLISEIGFLPFVYESSNFMRLVTGGIAGFVASFYALPLILGFAIATRNQKGSSGSGRQRS